MCAKSSLQCICFRMSFVYLFRNMGKFCKHVLEYMWHLNMKGKVGVTENPNFIFYKYYCVREMGF